MSRKRIIEKYLYQLNFSDDKFIVMADDFKMIADLALKQLAISKTETTSCEWCEIASACEYEVTFFKDDDRWATERSLLPKFCPNCGRRLEADT